VSANARIEGRTGSKNRTYNGKDRGGRGGTGVMYLPDELVGNLLLFLDIARSFLVIIIILLKLNVSHACIQVHARAPAHGEYLLMIMFDVLTDILSVRPHIFVELLEIPLGVFDR